MRISWSSRKGARKSRTAGRRRALIRLDSKAIPGKFLAQRGTLRGDGAKDAPGHFNSAGPGSCAAVASNWPAI